MQEIKKRRIVIASVLKPVDDPRMLEKLGMTLAKQHEVHIIGSEGKSRRQSPGIQFHSIGVFSRLSLARIRNRWTVLRKCLAIHPAILIVCTHELLWHALLLKLLRGTRIWYDVQENYYRNIAYLPTFPVWLRPILASMVRTKEKLSSLFVEHYILAERAYVTELTFPKHRFIVLENKVRRPLVQKSIPVKGKGMALLFTGTLSTSTGVFVAIEIAQALHELNNSTRLTICGYAPLDETLQKLRDYERKYSFIRIIGGDEPVPHDVIMQQILGHDFGVIAYPPNAATSARMPTKLYEYAACRLPMLLINNPIWASFLAAFSGGVVFEYPDFDAARAARSLAEGSFYHVDPQAVYWEEYEPQLLQLV